jgi:hypothetical protein
MIKQATLSTLFLLMTIALPAQSDSFLLTKNFVFKDGIYLSLSALHQNTPDYEWDELEALLTTSARAFVAKVAMLKTKTGKNIDLHSVLAISLEGVPYVRITHTQTREAEPSREQPSREQQAVVFAGLKVRGKIAYFSYETDTTELVEISAYNPLTKRPFRKGSVPVKSSLTVDKIFYFPDGRIADFTRERLLEWIGDDKQLWNTVNELENDPNREKLYKCLLIYDDRNKFYIGANNQ